VENNPSWLLPLLRSRVTGALLALLYLHPDRDYSLTEAGKAVGASPKVMSTEADRLVTAGLVREARRGQARLIRADTSGPVSRPLTDLLAVTYGPLPVLGDLLSGVAGVEQAYIYGSWAARYLGEPGPVPNDVDVLVVGTADEDDLYDAARMALTAVLENRGLRPTSRGGHIAPYAAVSAQLDPPMGTVLPSEVRRAVSGSYPPGRPATWGSRGVAGLNGPGSRLGIRRVGFAVAAAARTVGPVGLGVSVHADRHDHPAGHSSDSGPAGRRIRFKVRSR
jgi:hypothetical protein